jgi:hypothetical protein
MIFPGTYVLKPQLLLLLGMMTRVFSTFLSVTLCPPHILCTFGVCYGKATRLPLTRNPQHVLLSCHGKQVIATEDRREISIETFSVLRSPNSVEIALLFLFGDHISCEQNCKKPL